MDMKKYQGAWDMATWSDCEAELKEDLEAQLAAVGLKAVKYLPNLFVFSAVVANAEGTKWINISTADVRENAEWATEIKLRRMSSERDWKGDIFHLCAWENAGAEALKYLGDEYDDEIL